MSNSIDFQNFHRLDWPVIPAWRMPREHHCWSVDHHRWVCLLGPLPSQPRLQMVHLFHTDQSLLAIHWLSSLGCGIVSRVLVRQQSLHSWWSCLQHPWTLLRSSGSHWGASKPKRLSSALPIIIWMSMGHPWACFITMPSLQNLSKSGWILQWLFHFRKKMHRSPYNNNQRYNNHWVCNKHRGFNNYPVGNNNIHRCYTPITNRLFPSILIEAFVTDFFVIRPSNIALHWASEI